jgi:phosphopentomutase
VRPVPLGRRSTFADVGQTVADFLGVPPLSAGTSFLSEVWSD